MIFWSFKQNKQKQKLKRGKRGTKSSYVLTSVTFSIPFNLLGTARLKVCRASTDYIHLPYELPHESNISQPIIKCSPIQNILHPESQESGGGSIFLSGMNKIHPNLLVFRPLSRCRSELIIANTQCHQVT